MKVMQMVQQNDAEHFKTQFSCVDRIKVQILTQKALPGLREGYANCSTKRRRATVPNLLLTQHLICYTPGLHEGYASCSTKRRRARVFRRRIFPIFNDVETKLLRLAVSFANVVGSLHACQRKIEIQRICLRVSGMRLQERR